jgi:hypothetical protein
MTDDRDSSSNGTAESRNAEYDEIAQRIIDYRDTTGRRPGIYGANRALSDKSRTISTWTARRLAN